MNREKIEARCRLGNWATIATGFLALSSPLIFVVEAVTWLALRRWPTFSSVMRQSYPHPLAVVPVSLIVLVVGGASFFIALAYWRRQERRLRRLRREQPLISRP